MIKEIELKELKTLDYPLLIDVRSEGEFAEATLPGAINIPLLNNEERARVGTVYIQVSPGAARELGLQIVSPKLPGLIQEIKDLAKTKQIVIFCWRGGMRSKCLATVADLMEIPVYRLLGGYKAYRSQVLSYFQKELPFQTVVLRGNTGVGKTDLLRKLRTKGYPAVDLEDLANNRGSVFGAVGLEDAPSQKKFDGLLYEELSSLHKYSYIIVECESKRIGKITLPGNFYTAMQKGLRILQYDSMDNRVKRLLDEYTALPNAVFEISTALERLNKTFGHTKIRELQKLLEENRLDMFARYLLSEYYDKLYAYPNEPGGDYAFLVDYREPDLALKHLTKFLDETMS